MNNIDNIKDFLIKQVLAADTDVYPVEIRSQLADIRRENVDKPVIYIGMNSCGLIAGAEKTCKMVETYLAERNIDAEIVRTGCIGFCSAEPLLDVHLPLRPRISFKNMTDDKVFSVLDGIFNNILFTEDALGQYKSSYEAWDQVPVMEDLPYFSNQQKIVTQHFGKTNPLSIDEYIAYEGYKAFLKSVRFYTASEICNIISRSGLRGRGGAGFPTGEKWKISLNTPANQKYIICNADESDLGAYVHRALIENEPHLLIEGLCIAAYATGASQAIIYIRNNYRLAIERLKNAIRQTYDYGIIGHNIFESGFNLDISIRQGAGALVCGEETALISSIEGKRGMPRPRPPYPAETGLFKKPTVVNNVETLMNVPQIILKGPDWFSTTGTSGSAGTKVVSIAGKINRNGIVEIPFGTPLKKIVETIGGGVREGKKLKAIQLGGPTGSFLPPSMLDLELSYQQLEENGILLSSGGFIILDQDNCIVEVAKYFMDFIQKGSCGKCIPCREGTRRMFEILEGVSTRPTTEMKNRTLERFKGVMQLESLANVIKDTSLCGLGQTSANPVLSALKYFREEFEEHIFDRKCRANVCKELRSFFIEADKCTGCTVCVKHCPVNAIVGSPKNLHYIIEEKCIGCGSCKDVCKFGAVFIR